MINMSFKEKLSTHWKNFITEFNRPTIGNPFFMGAWFMMLFLIVGSIVIINIFVHMPQTLEVSRTILGENTMTYLYGMWIVILALFIFDVIKSLDYNAKVKKWKAFYEEHKLNIKTENN